MFGEMMSRWTLTRTTNWPLIILGLSPLFLEMIHYHTLIPCHATCMHQFPVFSFALCLPDCRKGACSLTVSRITARWGPSFELAIVFLPL